jgi:hypothetical protein
MYGSSQGYKVFIKLFFKEVVGVWVHACLHFNLQTSNNNQINVLTAITSLLLFLCDHFSSSLALRSLLF